MPDCCDRVTTHKGSTAGIAIFKEAGCGLWCHGGCQERLTHTAALLFQGNAGTRRGSCKRTGQLESCTRRRNLFIPRFIPRCDFRITGFFITHLICSSIIAAVQLVAHRQGKHGCSAQVLALQLEFPSHRCLFLPAAQAQGRMSGMLGVDWWKGGGRDMWLLSKLPPPHILFDTASHAFRLWFDCFYCFHLVSAMIQMFSGRGRIISHVCSSPP